jgi:hypothetical protein
MASSSEAFAKFSIWRSRKTPLKVTCIVGGKTDAVLEGWIMAIDPDAELLSVTTGMHRWQLFNVEGSTFSVEDSMVVATLGESDWLVFEKLLD